MPPELRILEDLFFVLAILTIIAYWLWGPAGPRRY